MTLAGRVAVVTGTSRGIGRAIALRFARAGASVVGCSLHEGGGFLDDLGAAERDRCTAMRCDVRVGDDVTRFSRETLTRFGAPDILVNNAGTVARVAFAEMSEATWSDVLGANLHGAFLVTRAFLPAMLDRKREARIINVSSIAGRQGTPLLSAYCAAKHGVVGLTRALAEELRPAGIAVNAICPGSVDTDMLQVGMPGGKPNMTPAQIADVAHFLAAEAPAALTGSCVDVFG